MILVALAGSTFTTVASSTFQRARHYVHDVVIPNPAITTEFVLEVCPVLNTVGLGCDDPTFPECCWILMKHPPQYHDCPALRANHPNKVSVIRPTQSASLALHSRSNPTPPVDGMCTPGPGTTSSEATGLVSLGVGLYDADCHADVPMRLQSMILSHGTPPLVSAAT